MDKEKTGIEAQQHKLNKLLQKVYKFYCESDIAPEEFIGKLEVMKHATLRDLERMAEEHAAMSELVKRIEELFGDDADA